MVVGRWGGEEKKECSRTRRYTNNEYRCICVALAVPCLACCSLLLHFFVFFFCISVCIRPQKLLPDIQYTYILYIIVLLFTLAKRKTYDRLCTTAKNTQQYTLSIEYTYIYISSALHISVLYLFTHFIVIESETNKTKKIKLENKIK